MEFKRDERYGIQTPVLAGAGDEPGGHGHGPGRIGSCVWVGVGLAPACGWVGGWVGSGTCSQGQAMNLVAMNERLLIEAHTHTHTRTHTWWP